MSSRVIGGLWIICDDLDIADTLTSGRKTASLSLRKTSLSGNSSILSLISTDRDEINIIAVATASKISGDLERKFTFGPAVLLPKSVNIDEALDSLPNKYKKNIEIPNRRVSGVPPASWEKLLERIVELAGIPQDEIDHLNRVIASREKMKKVPLPDVVKYEHDAVAVSLETFQGSRIRQQYLSNTPIDSQAPFIQSLEKSGANVLEDHMIDNDLATFPGMEAMRRSLIGAVEISTESGKLTLLNSNRTKIENTLGVDLVYYHHSYKSFTLVQYKRLTGDHEPIYRPDSDKSYEKEITRMRGFLQNSSQGEVECSDDFRMNENPFYFKFCNSRPNDHWSRMTPGMYIPLGLWDKFIHTEDAVGPRGGLFIGYENARRWLNNSEFVMLVRKGWIGSQGTMTDNLNAIIESQLAAKKSVIYAIHQEENSRDEHLRDARGRFASEEDIDAI